MSWKINRSKPASLEYTNHQFSYVGNSLTGTTYWVRLDDVRNEAGLKHWLEHLSEKIWFDAHDFLRVRNQALGAGL